MNTGHIERLLAHLLWADAAVAGAIEAQEPGTDILALYAHVLGAELVWLDRIEGRAQSAPVWPEATRVVCAALGQASRERYAAFLAALRPADLAREIRYTNSAGASFTSTLEDILLHVALHGSYHRGQIARSLRQAGAAPAATDYIAFVRGAPAATRAPK